MWNLQDVTTVLQGCSPQSVEDDIRGIARYLADSVLAGEFSFADGAHALAGWADKSVLADVAAHLSLGTHTEHLIHAAAESCAA